MTAPVRDWTKAQHTAIHHDDGDLLVSAGAGSGKTAVLAERCARLVSDSKCGVENLLVLTFTEAAAAEMKTRISAALAAKLASAAGDEAKRLRRQVALVDRAAISTLHAFCARILRQHFAAAGIDPAFEVMDEEEARLLREDVAAAVVARWHGLPETDEPGRRFADFFEAYAQSSDRDLAAAILSLHSMLASVADPAAWTAAARRRYAEGAPELVDHWVKHVVAEEVREAGMKARSAEKDAHRVLGDGQLTQCFATVAEMLERAAARLTGSGAAALETVAAELLYTWPTCRTVKGVDDFEALKKRTWEKLKAIIKKLQGHLAEVHADALAAELRTLRPALDTLLDLTHDFADAYTCAKRGNDGEATAIGTRVDFPDLERLAHTLLTAASDEARAARDELRSKYRYLLVDEFQDINPLQAALLDAINADRITDAHDDRPPRPGGLFVVGDVKQSIYGFRLAEPALFLQRERRGRQTANGFVALAENFRSARHLLDVMNGLFQNLLTLGVTEIAYANGHRLLPPPTAIPSSSAAPVEVLLVQTARDDDEEDDATAAFENLSGIELEARMVARRIERLIASQFPIRTKDGSSRRVRAADMAILLRAVKGKALLFSTALARRGIAAHADLSTGYFDTPEVREVLALLHVIDNPRQDIPVATALLGPFGRFSHDDLATIRLAVPARQNFAEAAAGYDVSDFGEKLRLFWLRIARWRDMLRMRPLHEGLSEIFAESALVPFLMGLEAGQQRVANLQALHQRALAFGNFRRQGLHRFLRYIEKLRDADGDFGEAPVISEAADVVRIMSVHKSKGLEFPIVFVSGMGSTRRNPESGPILIDRDLHVGLAVADVARNFFSPSAATHAIKHAAKRRDVAEELRLLYVAITRARDHLVITGHIQDEDRVRTLADRGRDGALTDDILLSARTGLEWILPALTASDLETRWPWQDENRRAQVTVDLLDAERAAEQTHGQHNEIVDRLEAGLPLGVPITDASDFPLAARLAPYRFAAQAARPAIATVTALKEEEAGAMDVGDEEFASTVLGLSDELIQRGEEARLRGLATHRVLELLDLAAIDRPALLPDGLAALVAAHKITQEEANRADLDGIAWFLATDVGKRVITAAKRIFARDPHQRLERELRFSWIPISRSPASPGEDPRDLPTIRGILDVLLADPTRSAAQTEIIDYKTDNPFTWQKNLPAYEVQMRYYLRAAADILGHPPARATLVFLAARQLHEIPADQ